MTLGHTATGYMCLTAFEHELEGDCNGTKVYPSLEALREKHKCLDQCGIVEVEVKSVKIVQKSDWSLEGAADRMFAPLYNFQRLYQIWKHDTIHVSSVTEIENHPALLEIVRIGKRAVPLIMASFEKEMAWWFGALCELTGADPVPEEDRGKVEKMRQHWLRWWAENKETFLANL